MQPALQWTGSEIPCCNRGLSYNCTPMRLQSLLFLCVEASVRHRRSRHGERGLDQSSRALWKARGTASRFYGTATQQDRLDLRKHLSTWWRSRKCSPGTSFLLTAVDKWKGVRWLEAKCVKRSNWEVGLLRAKGSHCLFMKQDSCSRSSNKKRDMLHVLLTLLNIFAPASFFVIVSLSLI